MIGAISRLLRGILSAVAWLCIGIVVICAMIILAGIGTLAGAAVAGLVVVIFLAMAIDEGIHWIKNRHS